MCSLTAAYFHFSTTTAGGPGDLSVNIYPVGSFQSWLLDLLVAFVTVVHFIFPSVYVKPLFLIILLPLFTLQPEDSIESKSDHTHCMITFSGITSLLVEFTVKFLQCGRVHGEVLTMLVIYVIQMQCSQNSVIVIHAHGVLNLFILSAEKTTWFN